MHGLDIALQRAFRSTLPEDVLAEATLLAAQIGVATGRGETLSMSLTGRTALPPLFSGLTLAMKSAASMVYTRSPSG